MKKTPVAVAIKLILVGVPATAQVSLSYEPTSLAPGVSTTVIVRLTDESGGGVIVGAMGFVFDGPAGLSLTEFAWTSGLDGPPYIASTDLPDNVQTALVGLGSEGVAVAAGESLDIAMLSIRPKSTLAGQTITLVVLPEGNANAEFVDGNFESQSVVSGRSVVLTIVGGISDEDPVDDDSSADDADDTPVDDGDDADNGLSDGGQPVDDSDTMTDPDDAMSDVDNSLNDDDVADDADGSSDAFNGDDSPDIQPTDDGESGEDEDVESTEGEPTETPPAPAVLCGTGMIPLMLFTLTGLSFMRVLRRPKNRSTYEPPKG